MEIYCASNKRIAKNTIMLYLRMMVVMVIGLYTSRVTLSALGVQDFGLYNVVGAVVGMLTFLNASISAAGSRFLTCMIGTGNEIRLRKTWSTMINMQVLLAIITVLVMLVFGFWLIETKANIPPGRMHAVRFAFYCSMVTTAVGLSTTPFGSAIISYERMSAFAWFSIVDVIIKLVIAFSLNRAVMDRLELYALLMTVAQMSYALINVVYCKMKFHSLRYIKTLDWKLIREIYSFAGWHLLTMVAVMLSTQGMTFLNQHYFGAELVAAYAIAVSVETHIMAFINNFRTAANPQIVKSYAAGRYLESRDILINSTLLASFLYLMLAVPVFVFSEEILNVWLVEVPKWSLPFVRICLISGLIGVFDVSLYMGIYAKGRLVENVTVNILFGVIKFIVAWVIMRSTAWPYTAAVVQCIGYFFIGFVSKPVILHFVVGYQWEDFRKLFVPSMKILIMSLLIGGVVCVATPSGFVAMVAGTFICAILIGICSWQLGVPLYYRRRVIEIVRTKLCG